MIWFSAYDFPRIKANNWQAGLHKMEKKASTQLKKQPRQQQKMVKRNPQNGKLCQLYIWYRISKYIQTSLKKVKETNDTDMGYAYD